jgi:hypothetical protein
MMEVLKMTRLLCVLSFVVSILFSTSVLAFKPDIHRQITSDALCGGVIKEEICRSGFDVDSVDSIADHNVCTDWCPAAIGPVIFSEFNTVEAHAEELILGKASTRLENKRKKIANSLEACYGGMARYHLGRALHTVQDAYSHTNFIDNMDDFLINKDKLTVPVPIKNSNGVYILDILNMQDVPKKNGKPIVLCDASVDEDGNNPEFAPTGLVSDYFGSWGIPTFGKGRAQCWGIPEGICCHYDMNKDSFSSINGKRDFFLGGTKFEAAKKAAIESTKNYMELVEEYMENEYGATTAKQLMKQLRKKQRRTSFVIDITGSMSSEIDTVKKTMNDYIDGLDKHDELAPYLSLVTFKDTDETIKTFQSCNIGNFKKQFNELKVFGGQSCEEASNEALITAIATTKRTGVVGGRMVLITDASAKDYTKGIKVKNKAKKAKIAIDTIITGDCYLNVETPSKLKNRLRSKSGRVQYNAISEQTGGFFFDIVNKKEVDKVIPILREVNDPDKANVYRYGINLTTGEKVSLRRDQRDSKTRQSVEILVDNTLSEKVTFMLTGSSANTLPVFTLTRPDGTVVQPSDSGVTYLQLSSVISYAVENPMTGKWQASFEGKGEFLLSAFGNSSLRINGLRLLSKTDEVPSSHSEELSPIVGKLVGGSEIVVEVRFTAAPKTVSLSLLKLADESVISTPTVTAIDGEGSRYFQATITVPTEPFKLSFKGLTAEGSEFIRIMPVPLNPQSVKITATPPFAKAMPQTTATFEMTVSNLSDAKATYTITASNTREWSMTLPTTVTVESGSSKTVTVNVDIPVDAVKDAINEVTIAVEDTNDPTIGNNTPVWLKVAENQTVTPASCQAYAVNDKGRNDSQFFTINLETGEINKLGTMYKGHDIESLAIHPTTNMIYAASGDNVTNGKKGHLYIVDGQTGELFPIGYTGFNEIEDLAFAPDGTLWAWAKGKDGGMITIDPTTGVGKLKIPSDIPIEGLTLSKETGRTIFYGSVNTELWVYDMDKETLKVACTNLLGETEALEMMPDGILLMGIDRDKSYRDKSFSLHAFDAKTCQVVVEADMPTNQFNDVEGIALPIEACAK